MRGKPPLTTPSGKADNQASPWWETSAQTQPKGFPRRRGRYGEAPPKAVMRGKPPLTTSHRHSRPFGFPLVGNLRPNPTKRLPLGGEAPPKAVMRGKPPLTPHPGKPKQKASPADAVAMGNLRSNSTLRLPLGGEAPPKAVMRGKPPLTLHSRQTQPKGFPRRRSRYGETSAQNQPKGFPLVGKLRRRR